MGREAHAGDCPAPVAVAATLRALIGYFIFSTITLPFIGRVWLGEIPVLALLQLPKTIFAGWLRTQIVMKAVKPLGLSQGSLSPDYLTARPYALAIAYLALGVVVVIISWGKLRSDRRRRRLLLLAFLLAAGLDFWATLFFASGRSLTLY